MKRWTKDDLKFPDDRRFCATCGAVLVDELEMTTPIRPKVKTSRAEFIEMNDDLTFQLSIRDRTDALSMGEIGIFSCRGVRSCEDRRAAIRATRKLIFEGFGTEISEDDFDRVNARIPSGDKDSALTPVMKKPEFIRIMTDCRNATRFMGI